MKRLKKNKIMLESDLRKVLAYPPTEFLQIKYKIFSVGCHLSIKQIKLVFCTNMVR